MEHHIEEQSGVTVIRLSGPIDVSQAIELRDLLGERISGAGAKVLVDLSGVPLIDSSGIGILVTAHRRAAESGAGFAVAGASSSVARVFELTRANKLLRILPTVEEGVAALS